MDQTDALIEALKAIIEQKDQQIADLRRACRLRLLT